MLCRVTSFYLTFETLHTYESPHLDSFLIHTLTNPPQQQTILCDTGVLHKCHLSERTYQLLDYYDRPSGRVRSAQARNFLSIISHFHASITTKFQTLKHSRYTTHPQHHVENNKITVCFGLGLKNVMPTARSKTPIRVRQLNGIILTRTRQNVDLCPHMRFKIFSSLSTSNSIRMYGTRRCVLGNEHVKSHHFKK